MVRDSSENPDSFAARLKEALEGASVNSFAQKAGITEASVRTYLRGAMPGLDKAKALADAAGVSLEWLASGRGPMRPTEDPTIARPVDPEFMGRLVEAVARAHKEIGINLPEVRLGFVSAEVLGEVIAAAESSDEYVEQLGIMIKRLKKRLKSASEQPGTGKRSA